jgi:hypothetical protein
LPFLWLLPIPAALFFHCPQSPNITTAVAMSAVDTPGENEMEMVEGVSVGGEDDCCSGDRLAASLPVSSTIAIDIPCQRLLCPLLCCHPTQSLLPAKMAEKAGSEVVKYMTVSDGNLSPPPAANNGFGSGTHLPPCYLWKGLLIATFLGLWHPLIP